MRIEELYQWEVETASGDTIRQYNEDGSENPSTLIPVDEVVRASILSRYGVRRHDILLDLSRGERFIRRFGRAIMKDRGEGHKMEEYLQCIVTNHYRLWVFSSTGQSLVTNPEYEVYI
jgi:hypothetical protein